MKLYNTIDSRILKQKLHSSEEERITLSFYKYVKLKTPQLFRDNLYEVLINLNVYGRIYVALEGINAQISVPAKLYEAFKSSLNEIVFLQDIRLNTAIQDNGKSFYKLKIKVRDKILADGLNDKTFDVTKIGKHLSASDFNTLAEDKGTIIVDMRNHYESEVGHFKGAFCPDADTFRDALKIVEKKLDKGSEQHIIMYCTGGIRCEKASAYFKHMGYPNVYQLEGGIIKYARDVKHQGLENKFVGKNFVFDERMGERISDEVISCCHQCGKPCDTHTNCNNVACNLLFIQCDDCAKAYDGCCSADCKKVTELTPEEQKKMRKGKTKAGKMFSKGRIQQQTLI